MQTIMSTFLAYRNPALSNNIFDPEANIYAGENYAIHRYGSLAGMDRPGGYWRGGVVSLKPPKSFDSGGVLGPGDTGRNYGARPEAVLDPDETSAFYDLVKSLKAGGGKSVTVHVHPPAPATVDAVVTEVIRRLEFHGR